MFTLGPPGTCIVLLFLQFASGFVSLRSQDLIKTFVFAPDSALHSTGTEIAQSHLYLIVPFSRTMQGNSGAFTAHQSSVLTAENRRSQYWSSSNSYEVFIFSIPWKLVWGAHSLYSHKGPPISITVACFDFQICYCCLCLDSRHLKLKVFFSFSKDIISTISFK